MVLLLGVLLLELLPLELPLPVPVTPCWRRQLK
jgi:hypothetical protein